MASATCFTLRLHVSAAPPQGGLTQALGLSTMTLTIRRKRINTALGLLLLAGLAYVLWPFVFGRGDMQEFCAMLQPGASPSKVRALAAAQGYELRGPTDGRAFIHSFRSFGRFTCDLRFGSTGLQSSGFTDNN